MTATALTQNLQGKKPAYTIQSTFDGKSPVTEWEDQAAAVIPGDDRVGLIGHWGAEHTGQLADAVEAAQHVRVRIGGRDLGEYELGESRAAYQALLKCGRLLGGE